MADDDDFFGGTEELIDHQALGGQMARAHADLVKAESELAELNALVEGVNNRIKEIKEFKMPDLMKSMASDVWKDPVTGRTIELVSTVNSAQPKDMDKRRELFDALEPLHVAEIVAEEFTVNFNPGDKRAKFIRALLGLNPPELVDEDEAKLSNSETELVYQVRQQLGLTELPADEKVGVHPSRFRSWLLKQITEGHGQVLTDAGIWHGRAIKVTEPKVAKPKKGAKA